MVWWIVAGLVVVPLIVVAVAAAGLRSRRAGLERAATQAVVRATAQAAALQPKQERLQAQLAALTERAATGQQRASRLKGRLPGLRPD